MKMKHFALSLLALASTCFMQAQIVPMGGGSYEVVGRNMLTNRDIVAYKETFEDVIYHAGFDSLTNTALLTLWDPEQKPMTRKNLYRRTMVLYDLENHTANWRKTINLREGSLSKHGEYVFYREGKDYSLLDLQTGSPLFILGRRVRPFVVNSEEGWLVCATDRSKWAFRRGTRDFRMVDLKTNEVRWIRPDLNSTEEMYYIRNLDDSTLLFEGNGLHTININDGSGWDAHLDTRRSYYAGGYTYYPAKVVSSPAFDTNAIYIADAEYLRCFDYDGNMVWETGLPSLKTSHSLVAYDKNRVLLVNQGYAECYPSPYHALPVAYGKPFIAGFMRKTGKLCYIHERDRHTDVIDDVEWVGNAVYLIVSGHRFFSGRRNSQTIEKYDVMTGDLMDKRDLSSAIYEAAGDAVGLVGSFVGSLAYTRSDTTWVSLHESDTTGIFIACDKGVLHLNGNLVKVGYQPYEDLYMLNCELDGLRYFSKGGQIIVVDASGHEVATLNFHDLYCTESEIYSIKDKTLYVINREQLRMK